MATQFRRSLLVLAAAALTLLPLAHRAAAQQIITTYAGGGPNKLLATQANLYSPAGMAVDSAGDVFVADTGAERIFKIDTHGTLTVLAGNGLAGYSGDGGDATVARLSNPTAVAVDAAGDVYIADTGNAVIREVLASNGNIQTVAGGGNAGLGDGGAAGVAVLSQPNGVALDSGGNLYISDMGNQRVRRVDATTKVITTVAGGGLGSTPATQTALPRPTAICVDASDHLYIGDTTLGAILMVALSNGNIVSVAGGGTGGISNGAAAGSVRLYPAAIYVDASGDIFDADSHITIEVPAGSGTVAILAGGGSKSPSSSFGGPATSVTIQPSGVALQSGGQVLVTDQTNRYIYQIPSSGSILQFAGNGTPRYAGDGASATDASLSLYYPAQMATDPAGDLFFSDTENNRVREILASNGQIVTVAGTGVGGFTGDGNPATQAELSSPAGVALDASGNLFIADDGNSRVRKVTVATGQITTVAGGGSNSGEGVPALQAQLVAPVAVAVDANGNLFISERNAVREVAASNGDIITYAGGGSSEGNNGPATAATVVPSGITLDSAGNLYIADGAYDEVREVVASTGIIRAFAGGGSCGGGGGDGGLATSACLSRPYGMAFDTGGNLYIADYLKIRRVSAATGTIETMVGTGNSGSTGFTGDGGPAIDATLSYVGGVALDASGNLYVLDSLNERIRKVSNAAGLPAASLAPTSVDFGKQVEGAGSPVSTVTLTNTGVGNLNLASIVISGANAGDFSTTASTSCAAGQPLVAAASCTLALSFKPSGTGPESATLTITDDASPTTQTVSLAGVGIVAGVSLTPPSVSFGNQTKGSMSAPVTVTLTNTGSSTLGLANLALSGTNAGDFALAASSTCSKGLAVAASATCVVNLTFDPSQTGPESATLTFTDDATPTTQTVTLIGSGVVPTISITPNSVSIGNQPQKVASAPVIVTVANAGPGDLIFSAIALGGSYAGDFNLAGGGTCAVGTTVSAASSCTLSLTFTPSVLGAETGVLTLTDNGGSQTVALSGTGTAAAPAVSLAPASLTFASQSSGTTSAAQSATLLNSGSAALTITSIAASGDFAETNTCGPSLAAGATCTVAVTFTPTASGARTGTLTLTDNATGSPHTIALNGTGAAAAPGVTLAPAALTFASQPIGVASVAQAVTLTNSGSGALTITSIAASGDYAETNTCGASLAASATCSIAVTFTPTASGARTGTLTLTDNATGSPHTVALSGTGSVAAPAVTLAPATLTFAAQATGSKSAAQTVTLSNPGSAALAITGIAASGDFAETNTCGSAVAAAASCTISVTFTPTATGARSGSLAVTDNAGDSPESVALAGTGADLTITPGSGSSTSSTVSAGQPATYALAFTPVSGLTGSFALTCTGAPTGAACTPSPASISLSGTAPVPVTVTVTTTARSLLLPTSGSPVPPNRELVLTTSLLLLLLLAGLLASSGLGRRLLISASAFGLLTLMVACGGGGGATPPSTGGGTSNPNGTPAGTYTLTVTATGGGATRTTPLTLVVN